MVNSSTASMVFDVPFLTTRTTSLFSVASDRSCSPATSATDSDEYVDLFYWQPLPTAAADDTQQGLAQAGPSALSAPLSQPNFVVPALDFDSIKFGCSVGDGLLTPLNTGHTEWIYKNLFSNQDVLKWYRDGKGRTLEETFDFLLKKERAWQQGMLAGWLITVDNVPAGYLGSGLTQDRAMEIGYALAPRFWGRGLATSAVKAALGYISCLGPEFDTVFATAHPENTGSNHVLEKCGFKFCTVGTRDDYSGATRNYYSLTRDNLTKAFGNGASTQWFKSGVVA